MKAYRSYKDSGVPWLEHVPEHWDLKRNKVFFTERKEIVGDRHSEHKLLSLTLKGIIYRDLENAKGKFPADFSTYQTVHSNDFVFCFFDVDETPRTIGLSTLSGMITGAYTVLSTKGINPKYLYYYYLCIDNRKGLRPLYKGLRKTVPFDAFMASKLPIPTEDEQQQIYRYLDWQTSKINKFIKAKKRLIALLKEQKQNIINEAVTKGINPDVEMKDSGVEWLGEIPAHWDIRKLKHIAAMKSGDNLTSMEIEEQGQYPVYGGNGLRGYYHAYNRSGSFLLVGRQGALCGNVHRVRGDFWATEHAVVTTLKKGICLDWYYYMLVFMNLNQYSEAAAQPGISVEKIQNLRTTVPPLSEQEEIAKFIDTETALIDKTIARTEREIELIQEYRTRLVSDVVTGKVDVRSVEIPDYEPFETELEAQDDEESDDELITEGIEE